MTIALLTNIVSPHQLPLAREIVKIVGADNYRYAYTEPFHQERAAMGWNDACDSWCKPAAECREFLESADLVYSEERDLDLFEHRNRCGKTTLYVSERWFKPRLGMLRLLVPSYLRMAWRFVRIMTKSNRFFCFPQGIHAARDMARLCGLFHGDLRCLFSAPKLEFECKPGGRVRLKNGKSGEKYNLDKIRLWGYFVEDAKKCEICKKRDEASDSGNNHGLRVLWVGRFLHWKRTDDIVRAVDRASHLQRTDGICLDLYGTGPDKARVEKLASNIKNVCFHGSVSINEVRNLMRAHDLYVLASNGYEGWGAVVSEALSEGMLVVGTKEAGSCASMLPDENLYRSGDVGSLSNLILKAAAGKLKRIGIGEWTPQIAAGRLIEFWRSVQ